MKPSNNQEKTRLKIAESFIKLVNTKHLSKISIADIMNPLSTSRQKFYYYFEDVNDLVKWVTEYSTKDAFYGFSDDKDLYNSTLKAFTYFYEHKQFFRNLLSPEGHGPYPFEEAYFNRALEGAIAHIGAKRLTSELEYSLKIYLKGETIILSEWLRSNTPIPPEILADYCAKAIPQNLSVFYSL